MLYSLPINLATGSQFPSWSPQSHLVGSLSYPSGIKPSRLPGYYPSPAAGRSPLLKFDWSPEATEWLKLRLSSPSFLLQVQLLEARLNLPNPDINQIVSDFSTLLLEATKKVVKFRKKGPPPISKNSPGNGTIPPSVPSNRTSTKWASNYALILLPTSFNWSVQKPRLKRALSNSKPANLNSSSKGNCSLHRTNLPRNGGPYWEILNLMLNGRIRINMSRWRTSIPFFPVALHGHQNGCTKQSRSHLHLLWLLPVHLPPRLRYWWSPWITRHPIRNISGP